MADDADVQVGLFGDLGAVVEGVRVLRAELLHDDALEVAARGDLAAQFGAVGVEILARRTQKHGQDRAPHLRLCVCHLTQACRW